MSYYQSFQTFVGPLVPKPGPSKSKPQKLRDNSGSNGVLTTNKHHHHPSQLRSPESSAPNTSRSDQTATQPSETGIMIPNEVSDGYPGLEKSKRERKNRPGQKFGAKKKSWVWAWFAQDPHDANVASCDFCGRIITRVASDKGSPKKLSEHLKTHKLTKDLINSSRSMAIEGEGLGFTSNGGSSGLSGSIHTDQIFHTSEIGKYKATNLNLMVPNGMFHNFEPVQPPTKHHSSNLHLYHTAKVHKKASGTRISPHINHLAHTKGRNDENQSITNEDNETNANNSSSSETLPFSSRRYSDDLENSPYSTMKFHKHLMKFLTENKLSINVIKSKSFQQLLNDLRPDSVGDLLELTGLYSSLLEVSRFDSLATDRHMETHIQ